MVYVQGVTLAQSGPWERAALLLLLSAASGAAALIYEVAWFQSLELIIGSTAVSLAVLLATFMGGTCLGSLLLPRLVSPRRRPLRVYAAIELGIGTCGVLVTLGLPLVGGAYLASNGGLPLRAAVAAICLLPPTILMGATLPALARGVEDAARAGYIYAANIAGAVFGSLLAGFYLLRVYDAAAASYAAAGINAAVTAVAWAMPRMPLTAPPARPEAVRSGDVAVYTAAALSGLCALGAETLWTRLLGLLFGASVYTFSIVLAVFLFGLGLGGALGSLAGRRLADPRAALGWCQWLAAAGIAWAACNLNASLPYWPVDPSLSSNIWFNFALDLDRALWVLLPAALAWGASFPLALAAASPQADNARVFAGVYAANTIGAIAGAVGVSLWLVGQAGSQRSQQALIGLAALAGLLLIRARFRLPLAAAGVLVAGGMIAAVPPLPPALAAHGRFSASWAGKTDIVYAAEGVHATVAVSDFPGGVRTFHVAGKIQASTAERDLRLQRMLGHLLTLTAASPRSILVIGCGAGITAGAAALDPRVERETIVEIEPLVPRAAADYFREANFGVLQNPRVQVRIDDGRHFLLTTRERFDGITIDPLDPWARGAAGFYTLEFLQALRQRLNPGGVATLYLQLFETNAEAVKSAIATFFEVFPHGTLWANTYQGRGHDMVLLGSAEPARIDLDALQQLLYGAGGAAFEPLASSLAEVGMYSLVDLFATYAGRRQDLAEWLTGAAINRDRNLRMQYLAGWSLHRDDAAQIYAGLIAHRRFPQDLFASRVGMLDSLRRALDRPVP
jgi:spermidine synthase